MSLGRAVVVALYVIAAGIGCGGSTSQNVDAGGTTDGSVGAIDGGKRDGGATNDAPICVPFGETCTGGTCCSGTCDGTSHRCVTPTGCKAAGAACGSGDTCCTGSCTNGSCPLSGCVENGQICSQNGDCCSGTCNGTTCAPVTGATCVTEGNGCSSGSQCCSQTCTNDRCANAGGSLGCHATGDICYTGSDCCSSLCSGSGGAPGTCQKLGSFGSGGCMLDGEPCTGGTNCCSRVCAPIPGAGSICQLASGCRVTGDVCHKDSDCCGGAGTLGAGAGEVTCNLIAGIDPPLGTCSNPMSGDAGGAQDPEGDVCGLDANARHDCIDCKPPKINCCKLDANGVPRCFGSPAGGGCDNGYDGTPACCIAAGAVCTFSSECCGGVPCLPDSSGILRCSTSQCVVESGVCTATSDCCTGLLCDVPIGSPTGTCKKPVVASPDAGTGVCAVTGQSCGDNVPCCAGYHCDVPGGSGLCPPGGTGCTCYVVIP